MRRKFEIHLINISHKISQNLFLTFANRKVGKQSIETFHAFSGKLVEQIVLLYTKILFWNIRWQRSQLQLSIE